MHPVFLAVVASSAILTAFAARTTPSTELELGFGRRPKVAERKSDSNSVGTGVDIYVISSGINPNDPCFDRKNVADWGFSTFNLGEFNEDLSGIGTRAACMVASTAPGARIISVKVVRLATIAWARTSTEGISYVVRAAHESGNPSIIYYALVGKPDEKLDEAAEQAIGEHGIHFVAMAGDVPAQSHVLAANYSPGRLTEVITVSAVNLEGRPQPHAGSGIAVDVWAYARWTRKAAAHVTGILAVAISKYGNKSPFVLRGDLLEHSHVNVEAPFGTTKKIISEPW